MKSAASYMAAALPEPRRVLGLLLRPFSLGHFLTLSRLESAFVDEKPRRVTREDVILTTLVCHFRYEEFWDFVRQANFQDELRKWGKKHGLFSIKEKAKLLRDYIQESQELPAICFADEDREMSGAHWSQNLLLTLMAHCGLSRSEALNSPLQQGFADMLKYAESNRVVHFLTEDELKQIEALDNGVKN